MKGASIDNMKFTLNLIILLKANNYYYATQGIVIHRLLL